MKAKSPGGGGERPAPAYLALHGSGELGRRSAEAERALRHCTLCPRDCGADRISGAGGACRTGRLARVASVNAHHGEESVISGTGGSGTIFLSQCSLHCVFCQNGDISHSERGRECGPQELAAYMLFLQEAGCHNINFVTPTHVVPQIIGAVAAAAGAGLRIPLVYNCGGYELAETLRMLEGIIDIYMPDFKFWRAETAERLAGAPDYPERAREALREMHRQVGDLAVGPDGLARRGLLVRHLVMPGGADETAEIMEWLATEISRDTFVNVMGQYRPEHRVAGGEFPEIGRRPSRAEMDDALRTAKSAGLTRFAD